MQDKSKKIIKPTRTYQTNRKFLKRKKNCCTNTESLDSESLEEIKLQWNAQRILKRRNSTHEQIKLHYTSRTHANTTHLPHLPLYPRLPHLPARISGQGRKRRGQWWTSDTISATLTHLLALTLFISDRIKRESASVKHLRQNQQSER